MCPTEGDSKFSPQRKKRPSAPSSNHSPTPCQAALSDGVQSSADPDLKRLTDKHLTGKRTGRDKSVHRDETLLCDSSLAPSSFGAADKSCDRQVALDAPEIASAPDVIKASEVSETLIAVEALQDQIFEEESLPLRSQKTASGARAKNSAVNGSQSLPEGDSDRPNAKEARPSANSRRQNSHRAHPASETRISVLDLKDYVEDWNIESQLRQHTLQSVLSRRARLEKFFWFLDDRQIDQVGVVELRQFFLYCAEGHLDPRGRWGNPRCTAALRPITIHGHYRVLKALYNYLVTEQVLDENPVKRIKPPSPKTEIKQAVGDEQFEKILGACRQSNYPRRDSAILLVLLDTGIRASELCQLKIGDWDDGSRTLRVLGKGNKFRTVYLGITAVKALAGYLRRRRGMPHEPLFLNKAGRALTASGLYQLVERLSALAGVPNPGVHALRRTFAVQMLRAGANVFTVQTLMGHGTLEMTRRYCQVAEADCEEQHRRFSPADKLKSR